MKRIYPQLLFLALLWVIFPCMSEIVLTPDAVRVEPDVPELIKKTGNNSIGFGSITYPCNIYISAFNKIPLIITPTSFNKLILENCVVNETVTYSAKEIVLGENVTVKSGARLELDYVDKITIKNAVKCEKGAELKINHVMK